MTLVAVIAFCVIWRDGRSRGHPVKYRYVITHEGIVEAETEAEAVQFAWDQFEADAIMVQGCEVEPIVREVTRDE